MKILFTLLMCLLTGSMSAQERIILLNEGNWQADNGRMTYFEDDETYVLLQLKLKYKINKIISRR